MVSRFDELVTRAGVLCPKDDDKKMSGWMDSQDVCILLNISPRTLQTLRDNGRLGLFADKPQDILSPGRCGTCSCGCGKEKRVNDN